MTPDEQQSNTSAAEGTAQEAEIQEVEAAHTEGDTELRSHNDAGNPSKNELIDRQNRTDAPGEANEPIKNTQ